MISDRVVFYDPGEAQSPQINPPPLFGLGTGASSP